MLFFFFNDTATPEIYTYLHTLSLHDALPIWFAMNTTVKTPWHLWVVGGLSLLWNAIGAFDYTMTKMDNAAYLAGFTPEQIAYFQSLDRKSTRLNSSH